MAKKRRASKRRFNLRRIRVTPEQALGTLASDTVVRTGITGGTSTTTMRVKSVKATWSLTGLTAGEGPISVGYAYDDYSVTEIKECLEAATNLDLGDKVEQEKANRLVREVGILTSEQPQLNDGMPVSTKLNWLFPAGAKLNWFAYNNSTGALTTGSVLHLDGNMWVQDAS